MTTPNDTSSEQTLVVIRHPLGKGWLLTDISGSTWTTVSEHNLKREAIAARDAALAPVEVAPPTFDDVARFIAEETAFADGLGNAGLLVGMVVSDLKRGRTTMGEFGEIKTSEGAAFDALRYHLGDDITSVYRVLAMLAAADPELATVLAVGSPA